jgi:mannose-6-phosphate isomerase-like protein (cupin superfamily)
MYDQILVNKGWGYEKWITNNSNYCGKLLFFYAGKKCSWHYHKLKDEVFYIQSGKVQVLYSEQDNRLEAKSIILNPGESFHVSVGIRHQIQALENTELFEFSTTHFESDSYRVEKGD